MNYSGVMVVKLRGLPSLPNSSIFVIIDRFTKLVHFIAVTYFFRSKDVATIFFDQFTSFMAYLSLQLVIGTLYS